MAAATGQLEVIGQQRAAVRVGDRRHRRRKELLYKVRDGKYIYSGSC